MPRARITVHIEEKEAVAFFTALARAISNIEALYGKPWVEVFNLNEAGED
jgi:hypothetical protein